MSTLVPTTTVDPTANLSPGFRLLLSMVGNANLSPRERQEAREQSATFDAQILLLFQQLATNENDRWRAQCEGFLERKVNINSMEYRSALDHHRATLCSFESQRIRITGGSPEEKAALKKQWSKVGTY